MWRQLSSKSARLTRAASTAAPKATPPTPPKPAAPMPKAVPQPAPGSGNAVYGVLFATVTTTIGWGAYIKQNPTFNPDAVKDNVAWAKFREFVLTTVPPTQALPETIVVAKPKPAEKQPVKKEAEKPKVAEKKTVEKKESAPIEKKEAVTIAKKATVKDAVAAKKAVVAKTEAKPEAKIEAKVEAAEAKVEKAVVEAEAAVVAQVAAAKAAVAEVVPALPTALKKKLDEASAKEKAVIDALNNDLLTFEEKAKETLAATKNTVLKKARAEADAMNEELDQSMLAGIKDLDADMLRMRVAQLVTEMKHRTKWEAMRLMESLKRMEEDVQAKHLELLQQQDKLHKELLSRELRLQEEILTRTARDELDAFRTNHESQLSVLVNQQQALIQAEYAKKLSAVQEEADRNVIALVTAKTDELEAKFQAEQESRLQELESFRIQLRAVNELLGQTSTYEAFSHQVHKVSVAALALTDRIEAAAPLHSEIRALAAAGKGDHLLEVAVASMAPFAEGAPSVAQLQDRFAYVRNAGRRAALVPDECHGMLGHLFAGALLWLLIPPGGPIKGDDAEAIFSRADYALRAGDIETTVKELDTLSGLPREVVADWVGAAKSRLTIEQTSKVVKAHVSLLAASLS
ncbi:hypothetical protein SDRG_16136 [Saprolegnia diclina VS20]|uniref:Mitofilin n=1 Tax=Saprolegnia diclina (strain VS20) TaxID=1156394 RepID=T0R1W9_SAPDV|nr:hypothetical protein SDRG_16136 [Saprolegnia diclina VS20]EQC25988.1 hypothetical protein SDRG_16136 [Saprolegnia diclina VS20]|eukprot:XP_008620556.1 hypothetical protein SDRG_16136 [Saprolegnia diclina VS20]